MAEQQGMLDVSNPQHMIALHYVFRPRIQRTLNDFTSGWNNHALSTEKYRSPRQMFILGALDNGLAGRDPVDVTLDYGVEGDDVDGDHDSVASSVEINDYIEDGSELFQILKHHFDPVTEDNARGLETFAAVRDFLVHDDN